MDHGLNVLNDLFITDGLQFLFACKLTDFCKEGLGDSQRHCSKLQEVVPLVWVRDYTLD